MRKSDSPPGYGHALRRTRAAMRSTISITCWSDALRKKIQIGACKTLRNEHSFTNVLDRFYNDSGQILGCS